MEFPTITGLWAVSRPSLFPRPHAAFFFCTKLGGLIVDKSWNSKSLVRLVVKNSFSNSNFHRHDDENAERDTNSVDFWGGSEHVEVIGIGSRKEAVLDFCLDSSFQVSSIRFWSIVTQDSHKVQLQQRSNVKDFTLRTIEVPLTIQSSPKTIILVVSAGYGLDHTAAIDLVKMVRSGNGLTAVVVLRPFSFEGQRRKDEVKDLVGKLKDCTSLFIDINTDELLKKDFVTLDEAVKTANSAVLLAINAITFTMSGMHRKVMNEPPNHMKEINTKEVVKILEPYMNGKVGFGAGYSLRTSILQSIYDCPFLNDGIKMLGGIVICVLASSQRLNDGDIDAFAHTFRKITGYSGKIILSTSCEPQMEPNLLMTTVLSIGFTKQEKTQKSNILLKLAQRLPFVFDLLWRNKVQQNETQGSVTILNSQDEFEKTMCLDDMSEDLDQFDISITSQNSMDEHHTSSGSEQGETGLFEKGARNSNYANFVPKGKPFERVPLPRWNLEPVYRNSQLPVREIAANSEVDPANNIFSFDLPVGVRPPEEVEDSDSNPIQISHVDLKSEDYSKVPVDTSSISSKNTLTNASFEAMRELYNSSSIIPKGKYNDISKKQGLLSIRASSMLEAERNSPKKWSPVLEMRYRGGIYRGRCQGGLPEGKGRLVFGDGSIYDGMWRCGKRSGLGTFYFVNGDVYQGSWRDDVMHGKGWFYFHTEDRWFTNFWKGKAHGEGRFYSKSGDVFFGHFQDGWRHGEFLCIDVDGTRSVEKWNQGFLVSREELDSV